MPSTIKHGNIARTMHVVKRRRSVFIGFIWCLFGVYLERLKMTLQETGRQAGRRGNPEADERFFESREASKNK
jgi:hypothetical protein